MDIRDSEIAVFFEAFFGVVAGVHRKAEIELVREISLKQGGNMKVILI